MKYENINKIIKENQSVTMKISNYPSWTSSEILKIDNEYLHIKVNDEHLKMLITVGDDVDIKAESKDAEYSIYGFVENIIFSTPAKAVIKIEDISRFENERDAERYNINYLCRVLPLDEQFKIQGITTDISKSGVSMVSYADFNITETVQVEIIAPQIDDVLKFLGNIERIDNTICNHVQYGIKITEIDNENQAILQKILNYLEQKS